MPGPHRRFDTRHTVSFELRPAADAGWTEDEFERWLAAEGLEREVIGLEVRDRLQRRIICLDAHTGAVLGSD